MRRIPARSAGITHSPVGGSHPEIANSRNAGGNGFCLRLGTTVVHVDTNISSLEKDTHDNKMRRSLIVVVIFVK
jgi:hypothetical protein